MRADAGLRADAARNRERVLHVARERLAAGDDSLQMNAIARLAGVGVGTVYRHFPTRQALLEALLAERIDELVATARAAASDDDPGRGLRHLLSYTLDEMLADPGFASVVEAPAQRPELGEALTVLIERARRASVIRPGVEGDDLRRLLCGVAHAVRAGDGRAELYLDVLLAGLRPPA